jgi:hypothetical protein
VRFPGYIPPAVADYISRFVDGDGNHVKGYAAVANNPGNEWIAEIVAFLRRFEKKDKRIEDMFSHLSAANLSDDDMKRFVDAACASLTDYKKFRNAVKKAAELNDDIAIKAEELARLLDDIQGHGLFYLPLEFQDVRTLLNETDSERDHTWWRSIRGDLTGQSAGGKALYAWGYAPSLAELLGTVAKAAHNYKPQFGGRIGAAIEPQQNSPKNEYIRAMWREFGRDAGLDKASRHLMHAVGCITTVAINRNGITADYEAVKQALGLKKPRKKKVTSPSFVRKVTF